MFQQIVIFWLYFVLPKQLFFPCLSTPETFNLKIKFKKSLYSLQLKKKDGFLFLPFASRNSRASNPSNYCLLYGLFFHTHLNLPRKGQISDMTSVFFFPRDLTVHFFFLGRAGVSFKSFSLGFLRNLSVWHVCHFSQSSSESW